MRAIIWTAYGPPEVLQLQEVAKPVPKDNEVLIKIHAASITTGDCEQRNLKLQIWYRLIMRMMTGLNKHERITVLGMELAGEIESKGKDVKRFKEGDQVFAATSFLNMGTYTEYKCLPEEPEEGALALKPANMTYEEAAPVPVGGLEALCLVRKGNIRNGHKVLINGAGGTIGTFTVQLARYYGAEVTAVDSTEKLEMLLSLGANRVIDYTQEDFTKSGQLYDAIFDVIGKGSFSGCIRSLKKNGRYLIANPGLSQMIQGRWTSMTGSKKVMFGAGTPKTENLLFLKELIETGNLKSVIDKSYPLEQTAEAHRYIETEHKKGNVVITI